MLHLVLLIVDPDHRQRMKRRKRLKVVFDRVIERNGDAITALAKDERGEQDVE